MDYFNEEVFNSDGFVKYVSIIEKNWNVHYKNIYLFGLMFEGVEKRGFSNWFFYTDHHLYFDDMIEYLDEYLIKYSSIFNELKEFLKEAKLIAEFKNNCCSIITEAEEEMFDAIKFLNMSYHDEVDKRFNSLHLRYYMKGNKYKQLLIKFLHEKIIEMNEVK
jgi:hypothetical protein